MLGGMVDVVVCESRDEVVAVIIAFLHPELDVLVIACLLGSLDKILRQQLTLLVEIVASTLHKGKSPPR